MTSTIHPFYETHRAEMAASMRQRLDLAEPMLRERAQLQDLPAVRQAVMDEFETVLAQMPHVGGAANRMSDCFMRLLGFMALGRVLRRQGVPLPLIGEIERETYKAQCFAVPEAERLAAGRQFLSAGNQALVREQAARSMSEQHRREHPGDFAYDFVAPGPGDDFEFGIDYKACGFCKFAAQHGDEDLLPSLCGLDFDAYAARGIRLVRTQTLAGGASHCNFRFSPMTPVTPVKARPQPFRLQVPDADIDDLRERLARTRWPDQAPGEPWSFGSDLGYVQGLVEHWRSGFDWRAQEARLNAFPQFTVPLQGIDLHFLHVPGQGPKPMPLLLSHGWPGSVFEFLDLIPRLTDPARFGGDPADAFTVVAPSLPGYGLSFRPGQPRFGVEAMADVLAELMSGVLGYRRYGAQGGDWGAFVTSRLGAMHADKLIGIHLNLLAVRRDLKPAADTPADEQAFLAELDRWLKEETGYQWIQGTRPQTLAFGLSDSPAGLAAWIVEKFRAWSDCGGDVDSVFTREQLLANIGLYWFTGAIGSSFWPYYARMHGPWPIPEGGVKVPMGYAAFPREIVRPPRSIAERWYTDIRRWTEMPRGGHFAAMEQPQALAQEIAAFFRPLREA